jgi:large subunit ribosomal protein L24
MMHAPMHVIKKDLVQVISGKEKGKTGKILRVITKKKSVVVEKLNMIKRHTRPSGKNPGGILEKEAPILACKVLLFCEKCNKGRRVFFALDDRGKKMRHCRKCKTKLDK